MSLKLIIKSSRLMQREWISLGKWETRCVCFAKMFVASGEKLELGRRVNVASWEGQTGERFARSEMNKSKARESKQRSEAKTYRSAIYRITQARVGESNIVTIKSISNLSAALVLVFGDVFYDRWPRIVSGVELSAWHTFTIRVHRHINRSIGKWAQRRYASSMLDR